MATAELRVPPQTIAKDSVFRARKSPMKLQN